MRLTKPVCPECGGPAVGTCDTIPGIALFSGVDAESGEADWCGETKVFWDGQVTDRNDAGECLLICGGGHEWWSGVGE